MRAIDWAIVAFCLALAVWGYLQGLVTAALALVGFAGGAVLGSRLGPQLLSEGSESPYAPLFALGGALFLGGVLAVAFEGVGRRLRERIVRGPLEHVDGLGGALLHIALALGIVWILAAVAVATPVTSSLRDDVRTSAILTRLNDALPPSGPVLNALARFDPFPSIKGPPADVAPPARGVLRRPGVRQAAGSVVRVIGTACGLGVEGSGWVVRPGLVVTNAHVVAGEVDTSVQADGRDLALRAQAVHFDATNDLALLRVPGLERPPLRLYEQAPVGTSAAILGYPENGPFDAEPARLGQTRAVISQDAYGQGPVERRMTAIRGRVRHGNSGGPVVDRQGRVLATVFAARTGAGRPSGFGVPDSIISAALNRATAPVSTGPCAR